MQFFGNNNKDIWKTTNQALLSSKHYQSIANNINESIDKKYSNYLLAQQRAHFIKWDSIENIGELIEKFEESWELKNNKITWASEVDFLLEHFEHLIDSKADANFFVALGSEVVETELVKLIEKKGLNINFLNWEAQLAHDLNLPIAHLVYPLLGNNEKEVLETANKIYENNYNNFNEFKNDYYKYLIEEIKETSICVLCADYLVPEFGGLVFNDNSGYINWCLNHFKNIVVIGGIDKVLIDDDYIEELISIEGINKNAVETNQITVVFNNPNIDLILLDNARSDLLKNPLYRKLLYDLDGLGWCNGHPESGWLSDKIKHPFHFGPMGAILSILFYNESDSELLKNLSIWNTQTSNTFDINLVQFLIEFKRLHAGATEQAKPTGGIISKFKNIMASTTETLINKLNIGKHKTLPPLAEKSFIEVVNN